MTCLFSGFYGDFLCHRSDRKSDVFGQLLAYLHYLALDQCGLKSLLRDFDVVGPGIHVNECIVTGTISRSFGGGVDAPISDGDTSTRNHCALRVCDCAHESAGRGRLCRTVNGGENESKCEQNCELSNGC